MDSSEKGKNRIGHYVLGSTLGSGTFGKVKMAEHKLTGHKVAVKILNRHKIRSLDVVSKIKREIQNLKMFRHPHIIKLYQVISTPTDIFMVMEYVSGGELFEYIVKKGKLKENEARKFFQQIISGVEYCHKHMIVHRDLKPENLLLDSHHNVKIADFGLSNMMMDGEFLRTSCGSPNYAAPEVISGKLYAGPEVDIWSSGIILFALLCGSLPFDDDHVPTLFRKIKSGQFHTPDYVPQPVKELLSCMLKVDPLKRATVKDIKENPWFQTNLPAYLFPEHGYDTAVVDEEAAREVSEAFNQSLATVMTEIYRADPSNQFVIAYWLIVDEKNKLKKANNSAKEQMKSEFYVAPLSADQPKESSKDIHPERVTNEGSFSSGTTNSSTVSQPGGGGAGGTGGVSPVVPPVVNKRSRWHLGIRSQSRPVDIMAEVFKAMKHLGYEWKIVNPYCVRVRRQSPKSSSFVKMGLQLYQVDHKSYLLDFKNIREAELSSRRRANSMQAHSGTSSTSRDSNSGSPIPPDAAPAPTPALANRATGSLSTSWNANQFFADEETPRSEEPPVVQLKEHQAMEFFEMCADLIRVLAK